MGIVCIWPGETGQVLLALLDCVRGVGAWTLGWCMVLLFLGQMAFLGPMLLVTLWQGSLCH